MKTKYVCIKEVRDEESGRMLNCEVVGCFDILADAWECNIRMSGVQPTERAGGDDYWLDEETTYKYTTYCGDICNVYDLYVIKRLILSEKEAS